jgi:predicted  nucleic acid-binding Zn-ribbon protein
MPLNIARPLYQLQEVELEIEANEQALQQIEGQLGESDTVVKARNKLAAEKQRLEELEREQRSLGWDIDNLNNKIKVIQEKLYGGRIHNTKELTDLQHEGEGLTAQRNQLEDRSLAIMEQTELTTKNIDLLSNELKAREDEWQGQQQRLATDLAQVKNALAGLNEKRRQMAAGVSPEVLQIYEKLRKQKGKAVVKVEQGICRGCRISLSVSEIQRARGGTMVCCSSCGRILFLP